MLGKRIISAAILIPIVGVAVYLGGMALLALIGVVGVLANYEYLRLMKQRPLSSSYLLGMILVVLLIADAQWPEYGLLLPGLTMAVLLGLAAQIWRGNAPGSLADWALAVAGAIYIGVSLGHFIRLREMDQGSSWLALALLGTWACDTGAYFVGRTVGKTPFHPAISPKKTREGAWAGYLSGVVVVMGLGVGVLGLGLGWAAALGVLLVLAATYGDLAESVIKRQVEVKDSGNVIPGHGGMFDRADSLLFVVPVVYWFSVLMRFVA
jgi:phosphatidate cytidylyltransferase